MPFLGRDPAHAYFRGVDQGEIGTGPPSAPYLGRPSHQARIGDALTLEPLLLDHPKH